MSTGGGVPLRSLGQGLEVSAIGLGCMGMSGTYGPADEDEARATIGAALDAGVTLLDTSDMYGAGHNEQLVGRAIKGRRDEAVVATKFGHLLDRSGRPCGVSGRPEYVRQAFEASARRLGVDHLDLYYQHRVDRAVPVEETIGAMSDLVVEGKVRFLGICEASPATIRRAHSVHPLAAVQSEYSLWWRGVEAEVLPACQELGIGFVAYSPLGRGLLTGAIRSPGDLDGADRRRAHPRFSPENLARNLELVEELAAAASGLSCTPAQLALAWLLGRSPPVVPIVGAKSRAHLEEDLGALGVEIDLEVAARLEEVFAPGAGAGLRYPEDAMGEVEV